MKKCLLAVLLAALTLGSDSPQGYDTAVRLDIEGSWQYLGYELNGDWSPRAPGRVETYRHGTLVLEVDGRFRASGPYKTDTTRMPPKLTVPILDDNTFGLTINAIYQIDGENLLIAYNTSKATITFADRHDLVMMRFKRVKP